MARTVTLMIIRLAYTHDLSADPHKEARRYRRGDIIDVMLTPPHATRTGNDWHWNEPIAQPRFGLIHMRDVPDERWNNMRRRFKEPLFEGNIGGMDITDEAPVIRRRRWRFKIPQMAAPKRNQLLNDGETTYAWNAARTLIVRKSYASETDESQDTETAVEDADLPA